MQLTNKQSEAIFKMEEFSGIGSHREGFENKEEFQAYWDLLDQKCKQKKAFSKAVKDGRVSMDTLRKKRAQNISDYYQNPQQLRAYGEKYYHKYLPSSVKLLKQLQTKCKISTVVTKVFEELLPILNDAALADSLTLKHAQKGKGAFEIRNILTKKLFPKSVIEQALKIFEKETLSVADDSLLSSQINRMRRNGKSSRAILQKYRGSIYPKETIQRLMDDASEVDSDEKILKNEIDKLTRKKVEKKKIIQRLLGKGFSYQDIKKNLEL